MSEEEKAIEFLKGVSTDDGVSRAFIVEILEPILNLIEKRQREIKELKWKENEQKELLKYKTDKIQLLENEMEELKGTHKEFLKLHQELKAEDTLLGADNIIKAIRKNYISKDKIRELIKEIEENNKRIEKQYKNGLQNLMQNYIENTAQIKILKQLLEEW